MPKSLTKEELAARLNGFEYRDDFPKELLEDAKKNNFVIIYGSSDDIVCFAGAIKDEQYACDGGVIQLTRKGIPTSDCEDEKCPYYAAWNKRAVRRREILELKVFWCGQCKNERMDELAYNMLGKPTWCYDCSTLNNKFATFDMFDTQSGEREYYCRGVVIDLDEVWPPRNYTQIVMEQDGYENDE